MTFLSILLIVFLFWLLAPLILGIPIVYLTLKQNVKHNINVCDESEIPLKCKIYFSNQYSELPSLGFSHISYFRHKNTGNPPSTIYIGIMVNPEIETRAEVYCLINERMQSCYTEFSCEFKDEYVISTYNAKNPSSLIPPERMIMRRVKIDNLRELLKNHLSAVEELKEKRAYRDMSNFNYIYEFERVNREILNYQEQKGLMKVCENGTAYRPTFIGAIKMTLKQWILFRYLKRGVE